MLDQSRSANANLPPIHYTWIGSPPQSSGVIGHDIAYVKSMAEKNIDNPIYFWCLEKYKNYYEDKFKDSGVNVKTIESLLNAFSSDTPSSILSELHESPTSSEIAKSLKDMQAKFDLSSSASSVRDRVTFKDLFTIFLLAVEGGYTLDTNIEPSGTFVKLPHQGGFTIAKTKENNREGVSECFLMYSSGVKDESESMRIRNVFYRHFNCIIASDKYRHYANKELYPRVINASIIDSLEKASPSFFLGNMNRKERSVEFGNLYLIKHYFNTHKPNIIESSLSNEEFLKLGNSYLEKRIVNDENKTEHQLFLSVRHGNHNLLKFLVKNGEDVNRRSLLADELGATPLHYAIQNKDKETVDLLLKLGADASLEANYLKDAQSIKKSGLTLAKELGYFEIFELIDNHQKKQLFLSQSFDKQYPEAHKLENLLIINSRDSEKVKTAKLNAINLYKDLKDNVLKHLKNGKIVNEKDFLQGMERALANLKKAYPVSSMFSFFTTEKNKLNSIAITNQNDKKHKL